MLGLAPFRRYGHIIIPAELIEYNPNEFVLAVKVKFIPYRDWYQLFIGKYYNLEFALAYDKYNALRIYWKDSSGTHSYSQRDYPFNTLINQSHYIVWRMKNGHHKVYINGRLLIDYSPVTAIAEANQYGLRIGTDKDDSSYMSNSIIQEVKFYKTGLDDSSFNRLLRGEDVEKDKVLDLKLSGIPIDVVRGQTIGIETVQHTNYIADSNSGYLANGSQNYLVVNDCDDLTTSERFTVYVETKNLDVNNNYKSVVNQWYSPVVNACKWLMVKYPIRPKNYMRYKINDTWQDLTYNLSPVMENNNKWYRWFLVVGKDNNENITLKNVLNKIDNILVTGLNGQVNNDVSKVAKLNISGSYNSSYYYGSASWSGIIKKVLIWNRELNDNEIDKVMRGQIIKEGLIYWFDFRRGLGNLIKNNDINLRSVHLIG